MYKREEIFSRRRLNLETNRLRKLKSAKRLETSTLKKRKPNGMLNIHPRSPLKAKRKPLRTKIRSQKSNSTRMKLKLSLMKTTLRF